MRTDLATTPVNTASDVEPRAENLADLALWLQQVGTQPPVFVTDVELAEPQYSAEGKRAQRRQVRGCAATCTACSARWPNELVGSTSLSVANRAIRTPKPPTIHSGWLLPDRRRPASILACLDRLITDYRARKDRSRRVAMV